MIRKILLSTALAFMVFINHAIAGPEGSYNVVGANPGGGNEYRGTVTVKRTGQTYSVVWNIGGTKYTGTGLGAANVKGTSIMGPASEDDSAISIGYISGGSFGMAFYVEQQDGSWKGVWTYGGSTEVGTETWVKR